MILLHHFVYRYNTYDAPDHRFPHVGVDVLLPSGTLVIMVNVDPTGMFLSIDISPPNSFAELTDDTELGEEGRTEQQAARRQYFANQSDDMTVGLPIRCSTHVRSWVKQTQEGTRFLRVMLTAYQPFAEEAG